MNRREISRRQAVSFVKIQEQQRILARMVDMIFTGWKFYTVAVVFHNHIPERKPRLLLFAEKENRTEWLAGVVNHDQTPNTRIERGPMEAMRMIKEDFLA